MIALALAISSQTMWRYRIESTPPPCVVHKDVGLTCVSGVALDSGGTLFWDQPSCTVALAADPNMANPRFRRTIAKAYCYAVTVTEQQP